VQTPKDKMQVVIFIGDWRIEGDLHILSQSRLTDALNSRTKEFLAVTDATIFEAATGKKISTTGFLDVNRASIDFIYML
jgi:hypothetical protein